MDNRSIAKPALTVVLAAVSIFAVWSAMNCSSELNSLLDGGLDGSRVCTSSTQCRSNEVCKNHLCVPAGICSKKSDCNADEDCVSGKCVPIEADGGGGGDSGVDTDAGGGCMKSEDCEQGWRCNLLTHGCEQAAIISVVPESLLDFGAVPYGLEMKLPVVITNKGKLPLDITGYDVQNPVDNECFRLATGGETVRLNENETHTLEIAYKQNGGGADTGKLRIASNDVDRGIYAVTLRSTYKGVPKFSIHVEDTVAGGWVKDYPKVGDKYEYTMDFGYVSQGTTKHKVIAVKNVTDGDAILSLKNFTALNTPVNKFTPVWMDGPDQGSASALPTPINGEPSSYIFLSAGAMAYLHVDYEAKNKMSSDGQQFNLATNDDDINSSGTPGNSSITLKLAAASAAAKIEVSPLVLDFGEVAKNTSAKKIVTISNTGDSDLSILPSSGIKFTTNTYYSTNPTSLEKAVMGHSKFEVEVYFTPASIKSENNFLVINSDDANQPSIEIPMSGSGTDPTLFVTSVPVAIGNPPTMDFGNVISGTMKVGTVSVSNPGFGLLYVESITINQGATAFYTIKDMQLNGAPKTLPANIRDQGQDTLTFKIEFLPTLVGTMSASMVFKNNDAKHINYTINLTGVCQNNKGEACQYNEDCSTGFCADGVCCETACAKSCTSCALPASKGTCTAVTNGYDPKNICKVTTPMACGTTGKCLDIETCEIWAADTVCAAAQCTGTIPNTKLRLPRYCSGNDSQLCLDSQEVVCAPYMCDPNLAIPACKTVCYNNFDCSPGYACDVNDNKCKLQNGQACALDGECASGYCSDGVCCKDRCDRSCEACNIGTTVGECSAVKKGDPDPRQKCTQDDPNTCKGTGNCSGSRGICEMWGTAVVCKAAECSLDKALQYNAKKCDGLGNCQSAGSITCNPYVCDVPTGYCKTSCMTNADCSATGVCEIPSGQTVGVCKTTQGKSCRSDVDCYSGFCTDGVCCNVRCSGLCEKCNNSGSLGTCNPVPNNSDPDGDCPEDAPSTCQRNGFCDGSRKCKLYASNQMCELPSCNGDNLNLARYCNGEGVCQTGSVSNCSPYTCSSGACLTFCNNNADCAAGFTCNTITHVCKKSSGGQCTTDDECYTGFCTDGVCCASRCNGKCERCDQTGKKGVCDPIPNGQDPDNDCALDDPATCQKDGACNGNRACRLYALGTICLAPTCNGNASNLPHTCNGAGTCEDNGVQDCNPYICAAGMCKTSCDSSADCVSGYQCNLANHKCQKSQGGTCTADIDCASGFCTDGVCCNARCGGVCEKCNQIARLGYCDPVQNGQDPDNECPWEVPVSCGRTGVCNGNRACEYYGVAIECLQASCSGDSMNLKHFCDGKGTCAEGGTQSCVPYTCINNACKTRCTSHGDCALGYLCDFNSYVCKKMDGQNCNSDYECYSNKCCNGKCANLMTNKDNCGSCGHVCQQNHANNQCINGSCVPSCDLGWANCDGNNDNGCDRSIGAQQNTCSTASYQGSWCGEESCGIFCLFGGSWENAFGTSGSNSVWYRANAEQCSSWCDSTVRHRVKLTVPQGVTYKLCIWWNCSSLYGCTDVSGSSTTMEVSKYDSDFTYYIEVRYVSGATCGNWNLSVDWRNCL